MKTNFIKEDEAKRIIKNGKELSVKSFKWNVPLDLNEITRFKQGTIIGIGRWNAFSLKNRTKFVCISQGNEIIYLEPRIIRVIYNSIKEDLK